MKTRWLAFAVAGSQLVARTRYSNECCVSNVAAEVLPDAVDVRCLCGTAMTPALLKGPMQRGTLLQKTAWTRGRAQSGGLFVSGFGLALCWSNYLKQPAKDSTPGQPERLVESGSVTNPPWLGPEGLAKYSWPRDHATWTECAVVEEVTLDGGTVRCRLTRPVKGWVNLTDLVPLEGDDGA